MKPVKNEGNRYMIRTIYAGGMTTIEEIDRVLEVVVSSVKKQRR